MSEWANGSSWELVPSVYFSKVKKSSEHCSQFLRSPANSESQRLALGDSEGSSSLAAATISTHVWAICLDNHKKLSPLNQLKLWEPGCSRWRGGNDSHTVQVHSNPRVWITDPGRPRTGKLCDAGHFLRMAPLYSSGKCFL